MRQSNTILHLGLVATIAGLSASATMTHLGTTMLLDVRTTGPPALPDEDAVEEEPERIGLLQSVATLVAEVRDELLHYNPFCPTCAPPATVQAPPAAAEALASSSDGVLRSALRLQLVGTMEADPPRPSYVTVYDEDAGTIGLFGEAESIRPDVVVARIDKGLLHIRHGMQLEYIEVGPIVAPSSAAAAPMVKPEAKVPSASAIPGAAEAIQCTTEQTCVVDKAFVDELLANPGKVMGQARFSPKIENGSAVGYGIYGVRKGSLPALLQLKNADVITAINGVDLTTIDDVMGLYGKLRHATRLDVTLQRSGKTLTREVEIR